VNNKFAPVQEHFTVKQIMDVWRQARHWVAALAIIGLVFAAIFIIWLGDESKNASVVTSTATPAPTATTIPTPVPTPRLVTVAYHVVADSDEGPNKSIDLWYRSGPDQHIQERGRRILIGDPYIIEVQVPPGTFVELFAAIQSNQSGALTCRIVVAESVIQENTSWGQGAGVYCEGLATP
jgi:hypothetical protein